MAEPIPCYLSLSSNGGILSSPQDITASIVRQFFGSSGNTSDLFESYKISFRMLNSLYGTIPSVLCERVRQSLMGCLDRYLNFRYSVNVNYEMLSDNVRYNMILDIVGYTETGTIYGLIQARKVKIDPTTQEFIIDFLA